MIAVLIAVSLLVFAALTILGFAGFRNGDWTGEALARALRKDLEQNGENRVPPC